ncbi:MAG: hypothetical protein B6I36_02240 [Desulfobacteraceae bacterium 4572_35.1]|nr:MAG: hypothetical protein B6I36_02240 [Desulfobacteraceae bacterium 4572_35.1]
MTECKVNPGRSVQADKVYLPDEIITLDEDEARSLEKRGIVTIVGTAADSTSDKSSRPNAKDSIKLAEAADSTNELDQLAEGEDRSTVQAAIDKRRAELAED